MFLTFDGAMKYFSTEFSVLASARLLRDSDFSILAEVHFQIDPPLIWANALNIMPACSLFPEINHEM